MPNFFQKCEKSVRKPFPFIFFYPYPCYVSWGVFLTLFWWYSVFKIPFTRCPTFSQNAKVQTQNLFFRFFLIPNRYLVSLGVRPCPLHPRFGLPGRLKCLLPDAQLFIELRLFRPKTFSPLFPHFLYSLYASRVWGRLLWLRISPCMFGLT